MNDELLELSEVVKEWIDRDEKKAGDRSRGVGYTIGRQEAWLEAKTLRDVKAKIDEMIKKRN